MDFLTKLEELFMLTIHRLQEPAYLVNIREHLLEHAGKEWAFGSIFMTLDKLCKKGFVESYVGKPSNTRGGKAIKYYQITEEGLAALTKAKQLKDAMWKGFSPKKIIGKVNDEK
jgi:DNA-binding PadR family transcriptional regulator